MLFCHFSLRQNLDELQKRSGPVFGSCFFFCPVLTAPRFNNIAPEKMCLKKKQRKLAWHNPNIWAASQFLLLSIQKKKKKKRRVGWVLFHYIQSIEFEVFSCNKTWNEASTWNESYCFLFHKLIKDGVDWIDMTKLKYFNCVSDFPRLITKMKVGIFELDAFPIKLCH